MFIKKIIYRYRRDFTALYECEHCGNQEESEGYDDEYYHKNVVPNMKCKKCGKKADEGYVPKATKYPEGFII